MECGRFEELIEQYLDDSLECDVKKAFEKHMSECKDCRENFEFSKEIRSTLQDFPLISVPENFLDDLNKRLDEELLVTKKSYIKKHFRVPAKYYGAVACLLLAVTLNLNSSDDAFKAPDIEKNAVVAPDAPVVQSTEEPVAQEAQPESVQETPQISEVQLPAVAEVNSKKPVSTQKPAPKKKKKVSVKPVVTSQEAVSDKEVIEKTKEQIDSQVYKGRVVIASAVESVCEIDEESVTKMVDEIDYRKSYTLLKEAAENKSIASVSTMEQLKNVEIVNNDVIYDLKHDGTSEVGAVGNSVIVYKRDADKINDILLKYSTRECGEFYVISDTEYEQFLLELEENGIDYTKSGAKKSSADDIMFKLVVA